MPKQPVNFNFASGLDQKTDPFQLQPGKFSRLENTVFDKGGLLQKRNGFGVLTALPDATSSYITTFNGDLTALGNKIEVYSGGSSSWVNKGSVQPLSLETVPLIRNNLNQTQSDTAVAANGLVCTVYTESDGTNNSYKYVIADSVTGQNIVAPTALSAHTTLGTPRVFLMGNYFIIVYTSSTPHLVFIAISTTSPSNVTAPADISTSYTPSASVNFDGVVMNGSLYLAWNGAASSGVKMAYISSSLTVSSSVLKDGSHLATIMSVTADTQNQVIWASYYNSATSTGYSLAVDTQLTLLTHFPVQIISSGTILNLASAAQSGVMTVFYETSHTDNGIQTNFISSRTVTQSSGAVGSAVVVARSLGLASKAFIMNSVIYVMGAYSSNYQPSYFLINGSTSTSASPVILSRLAYQNGGGYLATGIPSVSVSGTSASVSYLYKDLIEAVNKNTNVPSGSQVNGIYSQTGINLVTFTLGSQDLISSEIGSNLNLTGGFLWSYDGYVPAEQGFFLYPDSVQVSTATGAGGLVAQTYYYQVTYEWTDNQGNAFRSAPSIPVSQVTTTSSSHNTLIIPTLRLTYKTANPVKIVIYRWSTAQQVYYQVTSISAPTQNSTTTDSVTFVDSLADSSILGNNIIYTNGGVVENVGAPASSAMTLFDDRLWLVDSEDQNLLWFSKQVIESTPVEMSDLFTLYVAPTTGAQGSTGPITALGAMDDKLILFKENAIYYINGSGPDNTGANNQYSQPIFITSTVGCTNQKSIVLMQSGLMFQSNKGIWKLGRDLSTEYIGAPVEDFNGALIQSAVNVPETNQIRFTLQSGAMLMYDYYYGQWGTFVGAPAISSTIYQGQHTIVNSYGQVLQETPGAYLDGSNPVLIGFTTGWLNMLGLRGYERIHEFSFLGTYYSPHKLVIQVGYDYGSPSHQSIYSPNNYAPAYGGDSIYGGGSPYGGPSNIEQFRVFAKQQKCKAFQISVQEVYDPSLGAPAGAGLSLSGVNLVMTFKKGWSPIQASKSVG